jgi:hypothetical protein
VVGPAEWRAPASRESPSSPRGLNRRSLDLGAEFTREILPLIQNVPLREFRQATGLSLRCVSLIRRGERVPHPRHWRIFAKFDPGLLGVSAGHRRKTQSRSRLQSGG